MQTEQTPTEELAIRILKKAILNARRPDALESYKLLQLLKITENIWGNVDLDRTEMLFLGVEGFQREIAFALNHAYPRLISSSYVADEVVHYRINKNVFKEKLLPDIKEYQAALAPRGFFALTTCFWSLFKRNPTATAEKREDIALPSVHSQKKV